MDALEEQLAIELITKIMAHGERMDAKLDKLVTEFGEIKQRMGNLAETLEAQVVRMDNFDARLQRIEEHPLLSPHR